MNIIKPITLLMILFLSINVCSAESISGYVKDLNNNPVNNVGISDNASIGSTNTNSTGYYYIDGYTNLSTYILSTSISGYVDNSLSIDVNGNMTNANITITEKGRLYDIFEIMKNIIDNINVIVGMVIMAVTISIAVYIGIWIKRLLGNTMQ
jgi:hypothetical protein